VRNHNYVRIYIKETSVLIPNSLSRLPSSLPHTTMHKKEKKWNERKRNIFESMEMIILSKQRGAYFILLLCGASRRCYFFSVLCYYFIKIHFFRASMSRRGRGWHKITHVRLCESSCVLLYLCHFSLWRGLKIAETISQHHQKKFSLFYEWIEKFSSRKIIKNSV
jgi:hypothetical protein